ncbi:MAG TPA: SURF1 family protein [Roseiflexaceae bacterium]|jgi:surfeit locus 1 family protein|nr:SURF1 family protein [Roseiflexaceae bacterium]
MLKLFFTGWRLLITFFMVLVIITCCGLGVWQWNRLQQRLALNEKINSHMSAPPITLNPNDTDANALDYHFVSVRGTYDPSQEVFLRNRSYGDATGYHVLTPLRIQGSDKAVLIDRGWIPLTLEESGDHASYAPPKGVVTVQGVARQQQQYTGGPQDPPLSAERPRLNEWFQVNTSRIQQQTGYPLVPVFIEVQPTGADDAMPEGLPIPSRTTDLGPGPHMSYAIQWFSFALIALVGYPILIYQNVYKPRQQARRATDGEQLASAHH